MASAGDDKNRVISLSEVEKNNLSDPNGNCWIVLRGKVYDVTTFLTEHPGGEEVIKEHAGKDATDAFDDVGHSKDALQMTDDYQIGVLAETDKNKPGTKTGKNTVGDVPGDSWKDIVFSPTWTNFLIPAAIGIAVYFIYKGATRLFA
ncbi:hypothetical protein WR25_15117 [Diploscapter pachys]|uniref:Cytochrome b5 heme-binding domain-containing protein n=1 Tax=Diploscapter pachys TaxID=2018661 RepID=A0A2A2LM67_9BILA|nr:hypothetical protein WR25_15117 [Diploscapter pachys]